MTAAMFLQSPDLQLAWTVGQEDDRLFRRILLIGLLLLLAAGIVVPILRLPEQIQEPGERTSPPLTQIVIEQQELPKPEPIKPEPLPEPEPEPVPVKPQPKPRPELKKPPQETPKPAPEVVDSAREKAQKSGLLQFQDDLQSMRDSIDMSQLQGADITRGSATAKQLDRAMLTSKANSSSGGINTAALSRDVGGVALSGRETTRVESRLASATGRNPRAVDQDYRETGARSEEDIRKQMDRNQGAIFAIYNRALRSNPELQGKLVVTLVIEPSGSVSSVELVSSELGDSELVNKLLARVRMIRFGSQDVLRTTLNYTFDFLPY